MVRTVGSGILFVKTRDSALRGPGTIFLVSGS